MIDRDSHLRLIERTARHAVGTNDTVFAEALGEIEALVDDLRAHANALRSAADDSKRLVQNLVREL